MAEQPFREARSAGRTVIQQLRDTEVQQLHLAIVGDEDVGRFQIAMHDQAGVRMAHGTRREQKEPQPRANRQPSGFDEFVDRTPCNVLQRQIRLTDGRHAGVVQASDIRVIEGGQNLALFSHPFSESGAAPGRSRQLERDGPIDHDVGALGKPYRPHAARPQQSENAVWRDRLGLGSGVPRYPPPRRRSVRLWGSCAGTRSRRSNPPRTEDGAIGAEWPRALGEDCRATPRDRRRGRSSP